MNEVSSIGLWVAGGIVSFIIYIIRQEGKGKLLAEKLKNANELIQHLIDEGKNFKLVQGGYENTQNGMKVTLGRIEEKQQATKESIDDMKKDIKKLLESR